MRTAIAIIALTATIALAEWGHIPTQRIVRQLPNPLGLIGNPTAETYAEHGYYPYGGQDELQDGYRITARTLVERDGYAVWEIEVEPIPEPEPEPDPIPDYFEHGIETPRLVLQSQVEGKGIALVAFDDGEIVTVIEHESPRKSPAQVVAEARAKKMARDEVRSVAVSESRTIANAAAAANSVPALRAEVRRLSQLIEQLIEGGL